MNDQELGEMLIDSVKSANEAFEQTGHFEAAGYMNLFHNYFHRLHLPLQERQTYLESIAEHLQFSYGARETLNQNQPMGGDPIWYGLKKLGSSILSAFAGKKAPKEEVKEEKVEAEAGSFDLKNPDYQTLDQVMQANEKGIREYLK